MKDLQCMSFTSKGASEIVVSGWQDTMFVIDVVKGEIVKQVSLPPFPRIWLPLTPEQRFLPSITTPS
jgi:hypothetical protein